jgi:hypothetical protein
MVRQAKAAGVSGEMFVGGDGWDGMAAEDLGCACRGGRSGRDEHPTLCNVTFYRGDVGRIVFQPVFREPREERR